MSAKNAAGLHLSSWKLLSCTEKIWGRMGWVEDTDTHIKKKFKVCAFSTLSENGVTSIAELRAWRFRFDSKLMVRNKPKFRVGLLIDLCIVITECHRTGWFYLWLYYFCCFLPYPPAVPKPLHKCKSRDLTLSEYFVIQVGKKSVPSLLVYASGPMSKWTLENPWF